MIRAENLGKRFQAAWVFRGLTFEVLAGQCLVVMGRNGAGKSTLLKTLSGLIVPTEGKVEANSAIAHSALDQATYSDLSPREHLRFFDQFGDPEAWLRQVGLEEPAWDRPCSNLSTGMRARVKLAIALQSRRKILLLDEPSAGIDEAGRSVFASAIEQVVSNEGVVILATNDHQDRRLATHELEL
ncbi:MAG TPA: ABC transporter ATP-binding protein [Fimbriimonadaceae bacterium]|nr:ABC transporter ATP-binding protein [Fimbriimonadaceae bacterium]